MENIFPFGVTFYPDQWPKDYWEKAFSQIAAAGFSIVRFGEMSWDWVEQNDGKFAFEEMDSALDTADQNGIKVLLGIPTSQAPQWLMKKYPELRPVDNEGVPYPEYGPRPNVCKNNKTYLRYAERLLKTMVKRYSKHPAVWMWQLDNEPVVAPLDSTTQNDYCHCRATEESFREWAKLRYKTINDLNESWGTRFWTCTFRSFSEVMPPRVGVWDAGNPHIFLDWFRFKSESLSEFILWEKSLVKNIDQKRKIGTNGFIGICSRVPDHDVLSGGMEWYGLDIYPKGGEMGQSTVAKSADMWRSYTDGKDCEFHVTELQGGNNVRWGNPDHVHGEEIRIWTHQMVAHGAQAILYHNWRTPLFGSETGGFGILNLDGTPSKRLEQIKIAIKEVNKIYPQLTKYVLEPKLAIASLRSSEIQTYQEQGPSRAISGQWTPVRDDIGLMHSIISMDSAYNIIWNYHNPVAFIFERQLEQDALPYEVILLPNPYILTEKQAKVLKKYLYDGGILITEARFGLKNERGRLYERPLIDTIFDIRYDHTETIKDKIGIPSLETNAYGFRDIVSPQNGVLAAFDDGHPALVEKKIGKGKLLYATFSLFLSSSKEKDQKLAEIIRSHIPAPEIRITNSKEVEMVVWSGTKSVILYLINNANNSDSSIIKLSNRFTSAKDILGDKEYAINNSTIFLEFKPLEVKAILLQ